MKVLVLDGNSILNRAFYGIRLLTTKEGVYTNAVFGFLTTFFKVLEETSPDSVAIAFDLRAPTFRHEMYDGYKANRKGMPPELAAQMPVLKELLVKMGYTLVEKEGYEADDILGTFSKSCMEKGDECVIATGDRDSLQLVNKCTTVRLTTTQQGKPAVTVYDTQTIMDEYGVEPLSLIDIKAIQGDSSDNIPGVAGIGQKGALDLIKRFETLEKLYENIDSPDIKDSIRKKLSDSRDMAFLSKKLGEIFTQVPVDTDLNSYVKKDYAPDLKEYMARLELFSLIERLGLGSVPVAASSEKAYEITVKSFDSFDFDSNEQSVILTDISEDAIRKIAIFKSGTVYLCENPTGEFIKKLFVVKDEKITYNAKAVFRALKKTGAENPELLFSFDCMLAAYVINPSAGSYDLSRLFEEYQIKLPGNCDEFAAACAGLASLYRTLSEKINQNGQMKLLAEIEQPLSFVLADMELRGFLLDAEGIQDYGHGLVRRITELEQEIYRSTECVFNINSPKQLGETLFEKLGLKGGKKTKTGFSTNAEVLEGLRDEHPCIGLILEYRTLTKLNSTYVEGLLKAVSDDGHIHTSFIQTEARTGRLSSVEPNLQNIPVRTPLGKELRRFFKAKDGFVLVDADYSQIELRVLAHMSEDKNMINAFNEDADIHRITASQVFGLPPIMVTPLMRGRAKAVNFGIVYGIGAFSLSKDIGVTRKEAESYIEGYLNLYSGVKKFMDECRREATEKGYAETLFGRRRYLPELQSSNHNLRSFGERVAMNMPIQGTAADIIKLAMIKVYSRFKKENMETRLILQVHDELIAEAPESEAQKAQKILKEEMENAAQMVVFLASDVHVGKTWYDAKSD